MENSSQIVSAPPTIMEQIREEATKRIMQQGNCRGMQAYIERIAEESLKVWLEFFPMICAEMRKVNYEKKKFLEALGNKGKFTESYGWSEGMEFKWEYEYTPEFYFFMTNYVYIDFFSNENKDVCRLFMKKILRGDEAIETLMWVKKIYGNNQQQEGVVNT